MAKANLLITTRHLETPLHVACRCSKAKVIATLLEAAVIERIHSELVSMLDHRGYTPLMSCSSEDVRRQFEHKLASLTHQHAAELRKSLSIKADLEMPTETTGTEEQTGQTKAADAKVAETFSCAPSKFCSIM